jgi:DNA polymerase III epsilon subunit-like protein
VDVETAGPYPGSFSLLSIGACTLQKPHLTFYVEIQPIHETLLPEAYGIHGLSLDYLHEFGIPPSVAMKQFSDWTETAVPAGEKPLFIAFNAPFDWMFISDYFYRFLGHNPFGHSAIDIKAFYMGIIGCDWNETGWSQISQRYIGDHKLTHNALRDAIDQAEIMLHILSERKQAEQCEE